MNAAPPRSWDDAEYLAESVITYRALERHDLTEFLRLASRPARSVHPPMTKLMPIPMYLLFGTETRSALYAYTALIPLFCVYLFLVTRLLSGNPRTAVLAVAVTCCFPLTYGLWRLVMAEFGLAVAVLAAQYHLLRCAEARDGEATHAVLAGVFTGWGLLWKISFPVFLAGPLGYLVVRKIWKKNSFRSAIVAVALIGTAALVVAGPFYFIRIQPLWSFVVYNSSPSTSLERFSLGPVFAPLTLLKYWAALVNSGTSAYFALLCAALAIVQLVRRRWPFPSSETWFIASCAAIPFVFFSFQYLKEPRHLFPAFAMFGIMVAALLQASINRHAKSVQTAIQIAVMVFPVYQFLFLSFDGPWTAAKDIRLGPLVLLFANRESQFARPANTTPWPVAEVVGRMAAHSGAIDGRAPRVRVVGHIPFMDGPSLSYESVLRYDAPLTYSMLGDRSLHPTWWDFVVVLAGPLRDGVEYREPVLAKLLMEGRLPFTPLATIRLPEGREASVYRLASGGTVLPRAAAEDLLAAVDQRGEPLYPINRAVWHMQGGPRTVAVAREGRTVELPYVYVPDTATALHWEVVTQPGPNCGESYEVRVFDLNSRRGPTREVVRVFPASAAREAQAEMLGIEALRGQIVTIQLSPLAAGEATQSCLGWSELRVVPDYGSRGAQAALLMSLNAASVRQ